METFEPDHLLTAKEAAVAVNQHYRTIIAWIHSKWLPAIKRPGPRGRFMIRYDDLMRVANRPYDPENIADEKPQL